MRGRSALHSVALHCLLLEQPFILRASSFPSPCSPFSCTGTPRFPHTFPLPLAGSGAGAACQLCFVCLAEWHSPVARFCSFPRFLPLLTYISLLSLSPPPIEFLVISFILGMHRVVLSAPPFLPWKQMILKHLACITRVPWLPYPVSVQVSR